jgi:hypothetical protein
MRIPGWSRELADFEEQGVIRQLGIVLEQHPDRARLFLQWQGIRWPVWADAMDLLDLDVVPRSFLLDASGRVIAVDPKVAQVRAAIAAGGLPEQAAAPPARLDDGERAFLAGDAEAAIASLLQRVEGAADGGRTRFRLGVARMAAAERVGAPVGLFAAALEDWRGALAQNPSQYVWRRRIQQYGPRLDKPYAFYDWVERARSELRARGEEPAALRVEPSGTELAGPRRREPRGAPPGGEPDPDRRMPALAAAALSVEAAVVGNTEEDPTVRVHVRLTPGAESAWNDEGEAAEAWIRAPEGWELVDGPRAAIAAAGGAAAPRRLEFELRRTGEGGGAAEGYVLLDLCTGPEAVCARWRVDFRVPLP